MPPIRQGKRRGKPPPDGFADIEEELLKFEAQLRDAEAEPSEGKTKKQILWPIYRIHNARSRYIYDLYYGSEAISRELYNWLLKNQYANADLIAKWKKQGYENLCCMRCDYAEETNFKTKCICRVPKKDLQEKHAIECVNCGCSGCASGD